MAKFISAIIVCLALFTADNARSDDLYNYRYNSLNNSMQEHMDNYERYNRLNQYENDSDMRNYYQMKQERELKELRENMDDMDRLRKYGF